MRILVFSSIPSESVLLPTLSKKYQASELVIVSDFESFKSALAQGNIDLILLDGVTEIGQYYPQIRALAGPTIPILAPIEEQPVSEVLDVLDSTNDWLEWRGAKGEIRFVSSSVERITGYSAEDFLHDPELYEKIVYPDDLPNIQEHFSAIFEHRSEPCTLDFRIIDRIGDLRWIRHECNPIFISDKWSGHFSYNWDITKLKHSEDELLHSYQTIQALISTPSDIAMVLDLAGRITLLNDTAVRILGKSRQELIGQEIGEFSSPGSVKLRRSVFDQVMRTKSMVRIDDEGEFGSFDSIVRPILDKDGEVVQIAILARDITKRKKIENQLRERDTMLQTLIDNSSLSFASVDREAIITLADGKIFNQIGLDSRQIIGKAISEIEGIPDNIFWGFREALNGKDFSTLVSFAGQTFIQLRITPIRNQAQEVVGAAAVGMDISDIIRAEAELAQANREKETILNGMDYGIAVLDNQDKIIFANPASLSMTGLSSPEELTQLYQDPEILEIRDENGDPIDWSNLTPELRDDGKSRDILISILPKNASSRKWISFKSNQIYDEMMQDLQLTVAIGHDVTELKIIQAELESIQQELEQKIEQRTVALNQANIELQKRFTDLQHAATVAEAIARVAAKINMLSDLPDILQTVTDEAVRVLDYSFCSILLYDDEMDALLLAAMSPPAKLPYPFPTIPRHLYENLASVFGSSVIISDTNLLGDVPGLELLQLMNIWSGIAIPMIHDEVMIGLLCLGSVERGKAPQPDEINLLKTLAAQAAIGITKIRLFEQVSESRKRLRALSARLVEIQELERRNLAVELHDEIGQSLTLLRLNLDIISRLLPSDQAEFEEIRSHISTASETTVRLLDKVREISLDLRPTMLDDLGLIPALSALNERFTSRTNIRILLKHSGLEQRFDPDLEITVFRIIQEALTNAAKHAGVDQVSVRIWADENFLRLQVEDEGAGFEVTSALQMQNSSGLSGMIERAAFCGGVLEIDSVPNEGTCISCEFPLYIYREAAT